MKFTIEIFRPGSTDVLSFYLYLQSKLMHVMQYLCLNPIDDMEFYWRHNNNPENWRHVIPRRVGFKKLKNPIKSLRFILHEKPVHEGVEIDYQLFVTVVY